MCTNEDTNIHLYAHIASLVRDPQVGSRVTSSSTNSTSTAGVQMTGVRSRTNVPLPMDKLDRMA